MWRTGVVLAALGALAGGSFFVLHGCSSHQDCCGGCAGSSPAEFQLSCSSTDLTSVTATGPCATQDASLSSYLGNGSVLVGSQGPGTCHVELTFATGFTYSTDVTFASQPGGVCGGPQCKCPDYVTPTSGPFMVNNPNNTCIDAGAVDAEGPDSASDGATDVGDASVEATSSEAGSDAGQAATCTGTASCASGQVCCVINELTSSTACQVGPCPYQPGFGPLQLCATSTECFTAGDTCAALVAGAAGKICIAPKDGGSDAGDASAD